MTMADVVDASKKTGTKELSASDKLLKEIDSLPQISKELQGTLSKESWVLVRNLISKHVNYEFQAKK